MYIGAGSVFYGKRASVINQEVKPQEKLPKRTLFIPGDYESNYSADPLNCSDLFIFPVIV